MANFLPKIRLGRRYAYKHVPVLLFLVVFKVTLHFGRTLNSDLSIFSIFLLVLHFFEQKMALSLMALLTLTKASIYYTV